MHRLIWIPAAVAVLTAVWLWGFGGADRLALLAAHGQRDVQNAMAHALRALKAGEPGAILSLWALCFGYGFFHAVGPGHGKLVIGGYGLGRRVPVGRLSALAVASSLAQAATAVILVYAGVFVLGWNRETMQGLADQGLNTLSNVLVGGIGVWLLYRGARAFWRTRPGADAMLLAPEEDDNVLASLGNVPLADHMHGGGEVCETCGHAHGPTLEQAEHVRSLRDALVIIGAIAARPCTGAMFLLILTWRFGVDLAGIIGAFIMGIGTAMVTLVAALASVSLRESALMQVASGPATARMLGALEALAGAVVLAIAAQFVIRGY
ncbi:MAG: hypothetical protein NTX73_01165 [Rhodobacterales bacterium]|nr:hypothetical protein [Rhodobacterales bacterium]